MPIGPNHRAVSGSEREVHGRGLSRGFVLRMSEVRMSVEEQQTGASAARKGEQRPEHDRAIAAQDERERPRVEFVRDRIGKGSGERDDPRSVVDARRWVALGRVRGWGERAKPGYTEPTSDVAPVQGVGQCLDPAWEEAQYRRRINNRDHHPRLPAFNQPTRATTIAAS